MNTHHELSKGLSLLAGVLLAMTLIAGCSQVSPGPDGPGETWDLHDDPTGFSEVGFAEFPTDIGAPDYTLTLLSDNSSAPGLLAVFSASGQDECLEGPIQLKSDVPGISLCKAGVQVVLASRTLQVEEIADTVAVDSEGIVSAPGFTELAFQRHARVPGFGSLPISPHDTGSVTAYVMEGTGGAEVDQQSIAVGSYIAGESDLMVLDWWFLGDEVQDDLEADRLYSYDAFAAADGMPVPTASLAVSVRDEWIVMVRTTDGVERSSVELLDDVTMVGARERPSAVQ